MIYLARSLRSDEYFFAYVTTEILTQVEMSFTLISATVPTMQIFLKAAKSSLLGETVHQTQSESHGASFGARESRKWATRMMSRDREGDEQSIELMDRNDGKTTTVITKGSSGGGSLASESSERAIVMRQTVDIQMDSIESLQQRVQPTYGW